MNRSKAILPLFIISILISSCVVSNINPAADKDENEAKYVIDRIKKLGLVVIFPTEYKKERKLREFSADNAMVQSEIKEIREKRANRLAIWQKEIDSYYFSKISIVPDSLLKSYVADPENTMSISKEGTLLESSLNDVYVLYKEYGGFEIKRKEEFVANPFPNKNIASNWSAIRDFLGVQGDTKSVKNFFKNLNGRLFEYHNSVTEP